MASASGWSCYATEPKVSATATILALRAVNAEDIFPIALLRDLIARRAKLISIF
jgi:hypothetical protein